MPLSEKVPMGRFPLDAVTEININALNSILEEVPDPVINIKRIDLASNDPAYQIDDQSNTSRDRDFFERQNIRQLLSPKLNQTLDSDAILWVYITYTLDQDNPDLRVGHFINLQISVTAELYDQTGKKIWIDATRKTFPGGIIFGSWKATSPSGNSFEFDIDENLVRDISQSAMPSMLKSIQQSLFAQIKKEVDSN